MADERIHNAEIGESLKRMAAVLSAKYQIVISLCSISKPEGILDIICQLKLLVSSNYCKLQLDLF